MDRPEIREMCGRLGFLDDAGGLKQLDSLQQVDLVIESELVLGCPIPPGTIAPDVFATLASFASFLDEVERARG